jgi:DNA-directed RNA polymerase specialized sigma24 family protein
MKDNVDKTALVEAKLDTLIRLFAMTVMKGLDSVKEKAVVLSKAGLSPKEIAVLCDTTPNTISVALSQAKREAKG